MVYQALRVAQAQATGQPIRATDDNYVNPFFFQLAHQMAATNEVNRATRDLTIKVLQHTTEARLSTRAMRIFMEKQFEEQDMFNYLVREEFMQLGGQDILEIVRATEAPAVEGNGMPLPIRPRPNEVEGTSAGVGHIVQRCLVGRDGQS